MKPRGIMTLIAITLVMAALGTLCIGRGGLWALGAAACYSLVGATVYALVDMLPPRNAAPP